MDSSSLLQALGGGLLALLGGYAGASLARRTEYEKWLREEKSKAFADLLRELHDTRIAATEAMYDTSVPESERALNATMLYARLNKFEGIARLYMSERTRELLARQLKIVWLSATSDGGPADHGDKIREAMKSIQALLEGELHARPSILGDRPK
jgi:hypothetical protein